jgi:hypothetical protein
VFIAWLALFALLVLMLEGDWRKWLRGLVDIRAMLEQIGAGLEILRRNKRPLWVTLAAAVLGWTVWSLQVWTKSAHKDEVEQLLKLADNSAARFAWKHAFANAIVPLRDLVCLGDLLPLVIAAGLMLFARTAEIAQHLRLKTRAMENVKLKRQLGTIWVALVVLIAYRVVGYTIDSPTAPMAGGCLFIDALALPIALLVADGLLLSWILTEYARGLCARFDWDASDTAAFARGIPASMIVCALANPGRYVVLACAMWEQQVSTPGTTTWPAAKWGPILWASAVGQVLGIVWFALPAVLVVQRRGGLADKFYAYLTLLRRAGGRVVGLTVLAVLLNLLVMLPFYWVFGTMQPETWSLVGAASYGHYATLLLGLVLLAGVTQLAHQELGFQEDPGPAPIVLETAPAEGWVVVE